MTARPAATPQRPADVESEELWALVSVRLMRLAADDLKASRKRQREAGERADRAHRALIDAKAEAAPIQEVAKRRAHEEDMRIAFEVAAGRMLHASVLLRRCTREAERALRDYAKSLSRPKASSVLSPEEEEMAWYLEARAPDPEPEAPVLLATVPDKPAVPKPEKFGRFEVHQRTDGVWVIFERKEADPHAELVDVHIIGRGWTELARANGQAKGMHERDAIVATLDKRTA